MLPVFRSFYTEAKRFRLFSYFPSACGEARGRARSLSSVNFPSAERSRKSLFPADLDLVRVPMSHSVSRFSVILFLPLSVYLSIYPSFHLSLDCSLSFLFSMFPYFSFDSLLGEFAIIANIR